MNIVHVVLANEFTESMTYQENMLANQNASDGHQVTIIANCSQFANGKSVKLPIEKKNLRNGILLIRLDYVKIINNFITSKVRKTKELYGLLNEIKPDTIFFHSLSTWELYTAVKYKKEHPEVKLLADSHADYYTSATNWMSKRILHGIFYKKIIHDCMKHIDKILYISVDCCKFLEEVYQIPMEKTEFYPLGGYIPIDSEKASDREIIHKNHNIKANEVMLFHAGKLDKQKKTLELINAFQKVERDNVRLIIAGSISEDIKNEFLQQIQKDDRITYVGWKTADELIQYLNASDIYLQPGKVSAIAANAICSGAAVILNDLPDYHPFVDGNGWLISDPSEITDIVNEIAEHTEVLDEMKEKSGLIAKKYLDYKALAAKIYE